MSSLLNTPDDLNWFITTNQERLSEAYSFTTSWLRQRRIPYKSSYAGHFVFIDLRSFLPRTDIKGNVLIDGNEKEAQLWMKILADGLYLAPGAFYACNVPGWFRLTFVSQSSL